MQADDIPQAGGKRLLLGLVQGLCLYLLYRTLRANAWPATEPLLFVPLALICFYVPLIGISALGHMAARRLLLWTGAAALLLALLGYYDAWRIADLPLGDFDHAHAGAGRAARPSVELLSCTTAGLFIGHSLVMAAAREGRRMASYTAHFDIAWKLGVQLAFSAMFTGTTWLVLLLGSQLFKLVRLDFLERLLREEWFSIPVTTFAFACAMHLTDVRPAIVRGIRGLLLVLLSWLLPVTVLLVGGFLLALPFTGLEPLWNTRHAAALLLCAAAAFVVLINAAWQEGGDGREVARVVRGAARAAALLLAPLVLLAVYALFLRVRDHGWSTDRVTAAACMLVASCYAAGYFRAGLRGGWLPLLAKVNIGTAYVVLAVLLALFSPLLDPARVSVSSQLARLEAGKVSADKFDFSWLRFDGARFGRAALDRIERAAAGPEAASIRSRIANARKLEGRWQGTPAPEILPGQLEANLRVRSAAALPDAFLRTAWASKRDAWQLPECLRRSGVQCEAFVLDLGGDGQPEVLVANEDGKQAVALGADAQGAWKLLGKVSFESAPCARVLEQLAAGKVRAVAPLLNDIEIGGMRGRLVAPGPPLGCRPTAR
jgi:hypothetical protein